MQAHFGFFVGKNGIESFQGGIGKNRTFNILTRTSRKRKSFIFLTQSRQGTNPHFHGNKDLWYIPMPPPVPLIEGERGRHSIIHHSLWLRVSV